MTTTKRLSKKEWQEIYKKMESSNRNVTQIAQDYKISRHSIYMKIATKKKQKRFINKFKGLFK